MEWRRAIVTLLSGVGDTVATHRKSAVSGTLVAFGGVTVVAGFAKIEDGVAARWTAIGRASITGDIVAVIAGLPEIESAVSTEWCYAD